MTHNWPCCISSAWKQLPKERCCMPPFQPPQESWARSWSYTPSGQLLRPVRKTLRRRRYSGLQHLLPGYINPLSFWLANKPAQGLRHICLQITQNSSVCQCSSLWEHSERGRKEGGSAREKDHHDDIRNYVVFSFSSALVFNYSIFREGICICVCIEKK